MSTVIIEGIRWSESSFALIAQHLALQWAARPGLTLYFRDLPFWGADWKPTPGLLDEDREAALRHLPAPPDDLCADALLRLAFPMRCEPAQHRATFVYGLAEFGVIERAKVGGDDPARALATPGVSYITSSRWSLEGLVRSGAERARVASATLGYDPRVFRPPAEAERTALRRALGWDRLFVFLNVGTMQWNKGPEFLLSALAQLAARYPDVRLALKGGDALWTSGQNLREALDALPPPAAELVRSRIIYLGESLPARDLAGLYHAADAYVSPYLAEGFNLPVLEAAACGLPIICTAGGPTDDFTADDFTLRVRSRPFSTPDMRASLGEQARVLLPDPDHLTDLMARVVTDRVFRVRAARAGPAFVRGRFTWKHAADAFLAAMNIR